MNLENLNVQELSVQEQMEIDGGIGPLAIILTAIALLLFSYL
ncbi:MAG: class IIb bacteriocin, lactobin A/cerein 7B family [Flavobacteriales bacterium]